MTKTLLELRDLIDATDKELLALLNRRAGYAGEVGEIKKIDGSRVSPRARGASHQRFADS
jgi:chorismate mutase / prephenate dehydratase